MTARAQDQHPAGSSNWPRWRGTNGSAVSADSPLPVRWSATRNVRWRAPIPGQGSSSPIVWGDRIFLTSAFEGGLRRAVHSLDRRTGKLLWSREITDDDPESASVLTGYAAPTPATNGQYVVAFFGNAGVVCYDYQGRQLWHRDFGSFDSELGIASSPIIYRDQVVVVGDHDGDRFHTFDSFLVALDLKTGVVRWKTDRPGLFRSWSSPIIGTTPDGTDQIIVSGQDQLRAYGPGDGHLVWWIEAMSGWVSPSPVFDGTRIFAASGKSGPIFAATPGGSGDVTKTNVVWKHDTGGPYVCSPVLYDGYFYVHNQQGILSCFDAGSGERVYQQRLEGNFFASSVAGAGKVYLSSESGTTFVVRAGPKFELLARNELGETTMASPAIAGGQFFIRTEKHLYCIGPVIKTAGGRGSPNQATRPPVLTLAPGTGNFGKESGLTSLASGG